MTELETLQRAEMYMKKLANGINPLTDEPIPENDTVNNVRLSRCFFFVSEILNSSIEKERKKAAKSLPSFHINVDEISKILPKDHPTSITHLTAYITEQVGNKQMKPLSYSVIADWLTNLGFLEITEDNRGRRKFPTQRGRSLGITLEERIGKDGKYMAVLYSTEAQQFIIDNLPAILEHSTKKN